ncbi:MAG: hypothetical protein K5772_08250 [Clostridia bacterium]|nr:hypothetical protein [Clostridia bacterium]
MLDSIWDNISDVLGDTLSSVLESILNATIFKLCYYAETGLCRIINVLTQLFGIFAGTDRATYVSGGETTKDYLINIFFSNKAISNIYWAMALIGVALTIAFTIWSVIRKMFDASGKVQQSHGQILTSAVRSIVFILGLTIVMNVVITTTNVLMQQITYIFNDAYHLDQPVSREFTEEEYAAMGRVLSTVGNYSMVASSNNRYNLNLCFNDIRGDLYYLQQQGVFDYTYYETDKNGNQIQSWQSVLANVAKSANLTQDVKVDVYNQSVAYSITEAMDYLQNSDHVVPVAKVSRTYVDDNDVHLDRMVFLMGTMGAAKNAAFNKTPSMDDALRGPYYYDQGGNIYDYDQVSDDFDIGFKTDYIVVFIAACAAIWDLLVILLNCTARLFNMLFLYVIAPPIIAVSPLDNGGKFKQWSIAFIVQSLSVFGTVIAMRLLMIYLPIVMSPQLILFDNSSTLNMIAKFVLVFGGFEAAKKSTALLTGILADSAGWQSIQAGDMSSTASMAIGKAVGTGKMLAGKVVGTGAAIGGFVMKPVTNLAKRPFKAAAEAWSKLGTGGRQSREADSIQNRISQGKADEAYLASHPEDRKYLAPGSGGGGGGGGGGQPPFNPNNNQNNQPNNQQNNNQNNQANNPPANPGPAVPPPLPPRYSGDAPAESHSTGSFRQAHGMGLAEDEAPKKAPKDDSSLPARNRPTL